ncbi:FHA domain-containing protein [bacterium]|nr:MAG: FHA domain-containing protein [bacterium]
MIDDASSTYEPTALDAHAGDDHPQAGVASEGWSAPESTPRLAKLVLKRHGAETDIEFPINPPSVIGRFDPTVGPIDVDLGSLDPEGGYVSRKHAKILLEDGVYRLYDLGSSNGTYVLQDEFQKIDDAELTDGQEIAFGNARFVFRMV